MGSLFYLQEYKFILLKQLQITQSFDICIA